MTPCRRSGSPRTFSCCRGFCPSGGATAANAPATSSISGDVERNAGCRRPGAGSPGAVSRPARPLSGLTPLDFLSIIQVCPGFGPPDLYGLAFRVRSGGPVGAFWIYGSLPCVYHSGRQFKEAG
jgi:hypothetical protein